MSLNLLFVAAEMVPLVKVGGLADVVGSLPAALRRLGLDVRVVVPLYGAIERHGLALDRVASLPGGSILWRAEVREVPVYLVEHPAFSRREEIYGGDEQTRFLAFSDAVLAFDAALEWHPDLLHLHDWHPGFLAARLAGPPEHRWAALPQVCTIHNLGFPGAFDAAFARRHGLADEALRPRSRSRLTPKLAYSALAQGILHADLVTTVSPTYAREILTTELGGELTPLLRQRRDRLSGILNGIDVTAYDPGADPHLAARFDAAHIERRIENKRTLQRRLGLPVEDETPLLGMVSRLFVQKGPDLAAAAIEPLLRQRAVQVAVLGLGEPEYEAPLEELAARHPERMAVRLEFNHELGQLIYGGCDLFLMPSRYEPCGLGQFIAMRYGAVPVARRTGGLADSIEPYDPARRRGTGFLFGKASSQALARALHRALDVYRDAGAWRQLQRRCMAQDWSWDHSARRYVDLYRRAIRLRGKTGPR